MVKIKGPLFSLEAHGKLANTLNYSAKKTGSQVRKFHYPKKKVTGAQWTQRHIIGMITARWQVMTDDEKAPYIVSARLTNPVITGFNYFVRVAQADLKSHLGLVLYLPMNEESGDQAYDHSGQNNHGTLKPTYPSTVPTRCASINEKYGNALSFDGADTYVLCGHSASLIGMTEITVQTWFRWTADTGAFVRLIDKYYTNGYVLWLQYPSPNVYRLVGSALTSDTFTSDLYPVEGVWYLGSMTWDGANAQLYVNGVASGAPFEVAGTISTDWPLTIGGRSNAPQDYNLGGDMDEVCIFNRALSAAEIKKHYDLLRCNKKRQPNIKH